MFTRDYHGTFQCEWVVPPRIKNTTSFYVTYNITDIYTFSIRTTFLLRKKRAWAHRSRPLRPNHVRNISLKTEKKTLRRMSSQLFSPLLLTFILSHFPSTRHIRKKGKEKERNTWNKNGYYYQQKNWLRWPQVTTLVLCHNFKLYIID